MIASLLILTISVALLVYWFRYTCLLMLRSRGNESDNFADANRLAFREVESQLQTAEALDPLQRALERDFQILTYLLEHAPGLNPRSVEERLLRLDYRAMRLWYGLTRTAAPVAARNALGEMAQVLRFLSHQMGERAETQGRA